MKTATKRLLSLLLILVMIVCSMPVAFATGSDSYISPELITKSYCTEFSKATGNHCTGSDYYYFKFTPTESATYVLYSEALSGVLANYEAYEFGEDGSIEEGSENIAIQDSFDYSKYFCYLTAGKTYCFICYNDSESYDFDAYITKATKPTNLSFKDLECTKFYTYQSEDLSSYLYSSTEYADVTKYGITWASSTPAVASVDESGYLVCKKLGTTTITATCKTNSLVKVSCEITVTNMTDIAVNNTKSATFDKDIGKLICYKFTPSTAGKYSVFVKSDKAALAVCGIFAIEYNSDVGANVIGSSADEKSSRFVYNTAISTCELEAGKTYCIAVGCADADATMTTKLCAGDSIYEDNLMKNSVVRSGGSNRFATAFATADNLKIAYNVDKFDTIIVACGTNFPDALAGSSLAYYYGAPILLVSNTKLDKDGNYQGTTDVVNYIKNNLAADGMIYILGGESAVPAEVEDALSNIDLGADYYVSRLAVDGGNRFDTNLAILEECYAENQNVLLVCNGRSYPDALSASSLSYPILLVDNNKKHLLDSQKEFLENTDYDLIVIIGGTGAVDSAFEAELASYVPNKNLVLRIGGSNRYETSIKVALEFNSILFDGHDTITLATGQNFPDGLTGGILANAVGAPIILADEGKEAYAAAYVAKYSKTKAIAFGGTSAVPDTLINTVLAK